VTDLAVYAGLFAVALLAATILPLQSEAALVGLLLADQQPAYLLIAVASVGNTLGATINWLLGRWIERFRNRRWFPVKAAALDRATNWYRRYGRWSLLLSWVPVIGDPLTVAAGVLRESLSAFVVIVALAKTTRYVVLTAITMNWFN
jgi:membrane protein YqaA with SNARE-associated domain